MLRYYKMDKKIALFPGSFDPITTGHEAIVHRAAKLFDEVHVAIGVNSKKQTLFSLEQRTQWLEDMFAGFNNVKVTHYQTLTVNFCNSIGAQFILRGLRNSVDFNYEKSIAQMNNALQPEIETVFLLTSPELSAINSSIVREIYINGGDISSFIPKSIALPPYSK